MLLKIKAILWVLGTPLYLLLGILFALGEYDWGLKQYLYNARVYWCGGSYRDHQGRVFDKDDNQIYPALQNG